MKLIQIILLSLLISSFTLPLNMGNLNRLLWDDERTLTWDDFSADPDFENEFASALTSSAIKYTYKCGPEGLLTYTVRAEFIKDESWVKFDALTSYHLQHEQVHFDITELYARKIRKALNERFFSCDQRADLDALVRTYLAEWRSFEMLYDHETNHSLLEDEQAKWNAIVPALLADTDQYK